MRVLGIEREWRQFHKTITGKHRCGTIEELLREMFGRFVADHFVRADTIPSTSPPEAGALVERTSQIAPSSRSFRWG